MKNSIQFKHFRKFEDFPKLDFNDITFVVGKNNSGKSTFVKAFVMVYNYLKSGNLKQLDLNQGSVELLNIVTFDRALCKKMDKREDKNYIPITVKLDNYEFFINVTAKKATSTILDVKEFILWDRLSNFKVIINPNDNLFKLQYTETNISESQVENEEVIKNKIAELENLLEKIADPLSKESIDLRLQYDKLVSNFKIKQSKPKENSFELETYYTESTFEDLFEEVFTVFGAKYNILSNTVQLTKQTKKEELSIINDKVNVKNLDAKIREAISFYKIKESDFEKFYKDFKSYINQSRIFYLPATLNKQSALLSIRDKNNDLAEVVHKYYQLNLSSDPLISAFVKNWINEFQIGTDLKIELINGEAYNIELKENEVWIPLADKGMGSIQAVLLILRLASVMYLKQQDQQSNFDFFVIVEEPELNLHPALQSKLCDLFLKVYENYNIKFIIETHSEYIIRKTQLYVKEKELEIAPNENPFAVLYFNEDLRVWNMEFREDGKFSNSFGPGFFDESSNLAFDLM